MKQFAAVIIALEVAFTLVGIYLEVALGIGWPALGLQAGMGTCIALIGAAMTLTSLVVETERRQRKQLGDLWVNFAQRVSWCLPCHERDFYSMWVAQIATARNNVDITHLGKRRPQIQHGSAEDKYFAHIRQTYADSSAQIRRVERLTLEKREWITSLLNSFKGLSNVSMAVYTDPSNEELPNAVSVCRVDDRYGWLVALAEHESTGSYRDVLVTGRETVDLIARYFQERLWRRSIVILEHGEPVPGWEACLR